MYLNFKGGVALMSIKYIAKKRRLGYDYSNIHGETLGYDNINYDNIK